MKLVDTYDGTSDPLEGERALLWTSLPAGAKVTSARLSLAPRDAMFEETIAFDGPQGEWGATKVTGAIVAGGVSRRYVEIDFHKRRTLESVPPTTLVGAALQVDMGGLFVEINAQGAIRTPNDAVFALPADGTLPSLTVTKFRLIAVAGVTAADIDRIVVRSVPTNIAARLGKMPPFWARPGDLVAGDTSPDFADVLQVFLQTAPAENGFQSVPVAIRSDAIARLRASLDVEYVLLASVTPDGLDEVLLPFDAGSLAKAKPDVLSVRLPANARVIAGDTTAKVLGAFDDTRVAYGPTGENVSSGVVAVAAGDSQAQAFALDVEIPVTAVDLYVAVRPPAAALAIDIRDDFDGKPDPASLLDAPAQIEIAARAGDPSAWVTVPLARATRLQAHTTYWLIVQSLSGGADWLTGDAVNPPARIQHTQDEGLSWRESVASTSAAPPAAFFRLRRVPEAFVVPVDLQIGAGAGARRLSLDRFQPLGRVDFTLDVPEVAAAFNDHLARAATACSEAEHLANGDFEQWTVVGDDPGAFTPVAGFQSSAMVGAIAVAGTGATAYVAVLDRGSNNPVLAILDVARNRVADAAIVLSIVDLPQSIALHPGGEMALVSGTETLALVDLVTAAHTKSFDVAVTSMAFSHDGTRLYVLRADDDVSTVTMVATSALEAAPNTFVSQLKSAPGSIDIPGAGVALAVDHDHVYVLTNFAQAADGIASAVLFLDAETGEADGDPVNGATQGLALAVSSDGRHVVVANTDNTVSLIDSRRNAITVEVSGPGASAPLSGAVAISPDNALAFVAVRPDAGKGHLAVLDLERRAAVYGEDLDLTPAALAVTPQGDELYIGGSNRFPLGHMPLGTRMPADWFLTSGSVALDYLPAIASSGVVAVLASTEEDDANLPIRMGGLSQVAPVSGGCMYRFRVEAITDDPQAVVEVLWRGQGCQAPKIDRLPLPLSKTPLDDGTGKLDGLRIRKQGAALRSKELPTIDVRLSAPADAVAAEVRFTVPDGRAIIGSASLTGTTEALANGDMRTQSARGATPDGWTLQPSAAQGVFTSAVDDGLALSNNGPAAVDFVQRAAVAAGQPFTLDFNGYAVNGHAALDLPALELRWLRSDGSEAAPASARTIARDAFDARPIAGVVPAGAANAEIHVRLPSSTALAVEAMSMRTPMTSLVPVSFIAQSPGELRVSSARVGYEVVPGEPPPVGDEGLCAPTVPGERPGEPSESCCCACCGSARLIKGAPALTPAGRPMTVGRCATCDGVVARGGGVLANRDAITLPVRVVPHVDFRPELAAARAARAIPLTMVLGIGDARARQLRRAGIRTVRELSSADPQVVADALAPFAAKNAAVLIRHARELLVKPPPP